MFRIVLNFFFFILLFTLQFSSHCAQDKASTGSNEKKNLRASNSRCTMEGFSLSEAEHIIVEIPQPFIVRKVRGQILSQAGKWPEEIRVIFEIRPPDKPDKIKRIRTDGNGHFCISGITEGEYCFKATVTGWQSVTGTIIISKDADPHSSIKFTMPLGV